MQSSWRCLLITTVFLMSYASSTNLAWARGADSSGGGELLKNKQNPWFLNNTAVVPYCVRINNSFFSQDPARIEQLIDDAFSYWKRQLTLAQERASTIVIGTQDFVKAEECTRETPLWFQFGTLEPWQEEWLPHPKEFVGVSVRTSYDERSLSAKGFLYISPDHGPLRYQGDIYRDGAWSDPSEDNLFYLLVHEIGHIFGLPHFGSRDDVMGQGFPERLVSQQKDKTSRRKGEHPRKESLAFDYNVPRITCGLSRMDLRIGIDYLGISDNCMKFSFYRDGGFTLAQGPTQDGPWQTIGHTLVHNQMSGTQSLTSPVTIYLTGVNEVIPLPTPDTVWWEHSVSVQHIEADAVYQNVGSNDTRPLHIELLPNEVSLSGVIEGRLESHLLEWHHAW